jgi:anti-sigma factor ChrR (cupin superfamily)
VENAFGIRGVVVWEFICKVNQHDQAHHDQLLLSVLRVLPAAEVQRVEAHVLSCAECRQELDMLRSVLESFVAWSDLLRPPAPLWERVAKRIAEETGTAPVLSASQRSIEPEWEEVAPGISCQLLATDTEHHRVSMLVRLAPGTAYPPHRHAGVEELHLLQGELMIGDRKLNAGDYNRAEPDSTDYRVWSETGCTCLLVTSTEDMMI